MEQRCPNAKRIIVGKLEGYELLFRGNRECAFATVEPKEKGSVDVLLWEIDEYDEKALDRYEGYPKLYTKENAIVKTKDHREVEGMMYVMNPNHMIGLPNRTYLAMIVKGYIDNGLDIEPLLRAVSNMSEQLSQEKETSVPTMEM